jgi:hypothetical protein
VTLNLQLGAALLGSGDVSDYGDISAFEFDRNYGISSSALIDAEFASTIVRFLKVRPQYDSAHNRHRN